MAADAPVLCVARTSAAVVLNMRDKPIFVISEGGFQAVESMSLAPVHRFVACKKWGNFLNVSSMICKGFFKKNHEEIEPEIITMQCVFSFFGQDTHVSVVFNEFVLRMSRLRVTSDLTKCCIQYIGEKYETWIIIRTHERHPISLTHAHRRASFSVVPLHCQFFQNPYNVSCGFKLWYQWANALELCLLCTNPSICNLLQCVQYHVILDHVLTAPDCIRSLICILKQIVCYNRARLPCCKEMYFANLLKLCI